MEERKGKKRAAALRYDPQKDDVPVMTAFGEGYLAERIIEAARQADVPVVPDPSLASMLAKLSMGDEIPPALYEVVARILLHVSELDQEYGQNLRSAAHGARQ